MEVTYKAIGRRKRSVAQILLSLGSGKIIINKKPIEEYFQYNSSYLNIINAPLKILELETKYDVLVSVDGGGLTGQANAIKLAIARALCKADPENRTELKPHGFLTTDARVKERKKYGLKKARKSSQYSKR